MDVLEIDAASNTGVDSVRELRDSARYAPSRDRNKIFIIDEVHMSTRSEAAPVTTMLVWRLRKRKSGIGTRSPVLARTAHELIHCFSM